MPCTCYNEFTLSPEDLERFFHIGGRGTRNQSTLIKENQRNVSTHFIQGFKVRNKAKEGLLPVQGAHASCDWLASKSFRARCTR